MTFHKEMDNKHNHERFRNCMVMPNISMALGSTSLSDTTDMKMRRECSGESGMGELDRPGRRPRPYPNHIPRLGSFI